MTMFCADVTALVTMWTWITESRVERDRVLAGVLAPLLNRDVDELLAERTARVGSHANSGMSSHGSTKTLRSNVSTDDPYKCG